MTSFLSVPSRVKPSRKHMPPPPRSASLATLSNGRTVLWLRQGEESRAYALEVLSSDFGAAFRLTKADDGDGHAEEYDVLLDTEHKFHTCECRGFLRWQHCKHVDSLLALVKSGRLAAPAPKPQPVLPQLEDL